MTQYISGRMQRGFTIVELLIVIVVIAILAAITIVAYNGIQNQARRASLQSDASQATKQIQAFAVNNAETFPSSISSCPTPTSTAICLRQSGDNTATYVVDNSFSPRSYCYSTTASNGDSYYTDQSGQVLPGNCSQQSCYAIQQSGGAHGSGTYWIQPSSASQPMRVYCDMERAGGGWTLLMTNPGPQTLWNSVTYTELNAQRPSISQGYSILAHANAIKSNVSGNLQYRIDGEALGRWGGVFSAPFSTSLQSTSAQTVATLTQQFDSWTLDTTPADGTQALSTTVPWISSSYGITTWGGSGNWYGTLATHQSSWSPAPYISGPKTNPGIIWYWVR